MERRKSFVTRVNTYVGVFILAVGSVGCGGVRSNTIDASKQPVTPDCISVVEGKNNPGSGGEGIQHQEGGNLLSNLSCPCRVYRNGEALKHGDGTDKLFSTVLTARIGMGANTGQICGTFK